MADGWYYAHDPCVLNGPYQTVDDALNAAGEASDDAAELHIVDKSMAYAWIHAHYPDAIIEGGAGDDFDDCVREIVPSEVTHWGELALRCPAATALKELGFVPVGEDK